MAAEATAPETNVDASPISASLEHRSTLEKQLQHRAEEQDLKDRHVSISMGRRVV